MLVISFKDKNGKLWVLESTTESHDEAKRIVESQFEGYSDLLITSPEPRVADKPISVDARPASRLSAKTDAA